MSLIEGILSGNDKHDDIFEGDAVNVAVDDAIEIAGRSALWTKLTISMTSLVQIMWSS